MQYTVCDNIKPICWFSGKGKTYTLIVLVACRFICPKSKIWCCCCSSAVQSAENRAFHVSWKQVICNRFVSHFNWMPVPPSLIKRPKNKTLHAEAEKRTPWWCHDRADWALIVRHKKGGWSPEFILPFKKAKTGRCWALSVCIHGNRKTEEGTTLKLCRSDRHGGEGRWWWGALEARSVIAI